MKSLTKTLYSIPGVVRSLGLLAQNRTLFFLQAAIDQNTLRPEVSPPVAPEVMREHAFKALFADGEAIANGEYSIQSLLLKRSPGTLANLFRIFWDAADLPRRRKENAIHDVPSADNFPDYYARNFHFQRDGYLSKRSAQIYDHQVEILFSGLADPMRRLALAPLMKAMKHIESPMILEQAAGTGRFTRMMSKELPNARIIATDLSEPYLAELDKTERSNIKTIPGNATEGPLRNESADAVVSVFLHHELPSRERMKVHQEAIRQLRPGGVYIVLDSLQRGNIPELDPALEQFPKDYHEPFYKSYVEESLAQKLEEIGFTIKEENYRFLSKCVVAIKP